MKIKSKAFIVTLLSALMVLATIFGFGSLKQEKSALNGVYAGEFTAFAEEETQGEVGVVQGMLSTDGAYLLLATPLTITDFSAYSAVGYEITKDGEAFVADGLESNAYYTGITVNTADGTITWTMEQIFDENTTGMIVAEIEYDKTITYSVTPYAISATDGKIYGSTASVEGVHVHTFTYEMQTRKDRYAVGETYYEPFAKYNEKIVMSATCSGCGETYAVESYEIDKTAMALGQTEVEFSAVVDGATVKGAIPVEVYDDRVRIEAETWFDTTPDTTQTHAVYNSVKTRSPGLELTANNSYVEFHYFAEKTQEVSVVLAFAYTNITAKSGYQAAQVGDSQVNKFLTFSINGENIAIDNDVILYGGGADDGVARHGYTNTSTYIYLDSVYLNQGENVLRFTQKCGNNIYTSIVGGNALITMDALELFPVKGHSHDWQLVPRARRTMFVEGETFTNRFADYGDKLAKVVCSCGEEVETSATIDKTGALTTADTQIVFSAQYKGKKLSATLPIQVFASDAYTKIQAESLLESQPATGSENHWRDGGKNYNENSQGQMTGSKWSTVELSEKSGTAVNQTTQMTINLYSATEKTVYIVFGMTTTHSNEGGMSIDDVQVNDVVSFKVNGQAVEIGDDQVVWGIEQASKRADSKWRNNSAFDFVLVKVTLHAGYNVINLQGIANSYKNVGGGTATTPAMVRFDYIELFETGE